MPNLPRGTITFLFTDIEGSTRLWEQHREAMRQALARHDALLREAIESHNGYVFKTVGDAFCAAFATAGEALVAALAAQQALQVEDWGELEALRVRMALHTGSAQERDDDYFGPPLNRVARLLAIGYGGQVLLSLPVEELVRDDLPPGMMLKDLGLHRLRDLTSPETVYQALHPDLPADFPPLKSLNTLPTNLPVQLTSFIGRDKEIQAIQNLLATTRLLTLTGAGGCGKTRLALQVAADLLEQYPDGVWLVELAALSDPALVPQTIASALDVKEEAGRALIQTLEDHLREKSLLVVVDNCEHLISDTARLVNTLLKSCSRITILATSREPLSIPGEHLYRVPSLLPPDPGSLPPEEKDLPAIVAEYDAVRLFVERASLQQPAFTLNRHNATAVAQICYRLDGIPLAIELAAARTRALPVEEMSARLDDRFRLLTGGSRTALPRQQTLRALIDWSYELLNEPEKRLFHRLSVFAGGATLEAAEKVCADESIEEWEVLNLLTALVDKSLIVYEDMGATARYRLLETIRQYAREKLNQSGEANTILARHRDYFLEFAGSAATKLNSAEVGTWLDRLESEHDNLRTALDWCRQDPDSVEAGLRLAGALWQFWSMHSYLTEGRERLAAALARPGAQEAVRARAEALSGVGALAYYQGDYDTSRAAFRESLALRRSLDDDLGIANSLQNLALLDTHQGDYASARPLYAEAVEIYRALGNRSGEAICLNNMGLIDLEEGHYAATLPLFETSLALLQEVSNPHVETRVLSNIGAALQGLGDLTQAEARYQASLALSRELGNKNGIVLALGNLGQLAVQRGDILAALSYTTEALTISQEIGEKRVIAYALESFAAIAAMRAEWGRAVKLYAAAEALREAIGVPLAVKEREAYEKKVAIVREALGDQVFTETWAEGKAMEMDRMIALALQ